MRVPPLLPLVLLAVLTAAPCRGQERVAASTPPTLEKGESYVVRLTEFKLAKEVAARSSNEAILKALDDAHNSGDVEVLESIRLSVFEGHECSIQIGRTTSVKQGMVMAAGRSPMPQTRYQSIGTTVRVTATPSAEKILLKLAYESSRFDGQKTEENPPDMTTVQVSTSLALARDATAILAGGTSGDSTIFLAISLK
jgi:hypothetical protein